MQIFGIMRSVQILVQCTIDYADQTYGLTDQLVDIWGQQGPGSRLLKIASRLFSVAAQR